MNVNDILDKWKKDSFIDKTKIDSESLKSSELHYEFMNILIKENALLVKMKNEFNALSHQKRHFYLDGAKTLSEVKDIKKVPQKIVLKNEVDGYILADDDIIKATQELADQQDKVDLLKSILNVINKRSYDIKNYIDFLRFQNGN